MQNEKILVGSANTLVRVLCFFFFLLLILFGSFAHSLLGNFQDQQKILVESSKELGQLKEKVLFLEDIVINKTYEIKRNLK